MEFRIQPTQKKGGHSTASSAPSSVQVPMPGRDPLGSPISSVIGNPKPPHNISPLGSFAMPILQLNQEVSPLLQTNLEVQTPSMMGGSPLLQSGREVAGSPTHSLVSEAMQRIEQQISFGDSVRSNHSWEANSMRPEPVDRGRSAVDILNREAASCEQGIDKNMFVRGHLGDFCKQHLGGNESSDMRMAADHSTWTDSVNASLQAEGYYLKALHRAFNELAAEVAQQRHNPLGQRQTADALGDRDKAVLANLDSEVKTLKFTWASGYSALKQDVHELKVQLSQGSSAHNNDTSPRKSQGVDDVQRQLNRLQDLVEPLRLEVQAMKFTWSSAHTAMMEDMRELMQRFNQAAPPAQRLPASSEQPLPSRQQLSATPMQIGTVIPNPKPESPAGDPKYIIGNLAGDPGARSPGPPALVMVMQRKEEEQASLGTTSSKNGESDNKVRLVRREESPMHTPKQSLNGEPQCQSRREESPRHTTPKQKLKGEPHRQSSSHTTPKQSLKGEPQRQSSARGPSFGALSSPTPSYNSHISGQFPSQAARVIHTEARPQQHTHPHPGSPKQRPQQHPHQRPYSPQQRSSSLQQRPQQSPHQLSFVNRAYTQESEGNVSVASTNMMHGSMSLPLGSPIAMMSGSSRASTPHLAPSMPPASFQWGTRMPQLSATNLAS